MISVILSALIAASMTAPVRVSPAECQSVLYTPTFTITTVRTEDGNVWDFYGESASDCVILFDTMGTPNVTDDAIIAVFPR